MMFKRLETLQKQIYGEMNICLLYTYKNIGTCYLGIGQSEQARKYFRDCIELIEGAVYDCEKPELKIKDREEIATLNQNMYLTFVSERAFDKALECSKKSIAIISDIYGPRSKKLPSKYYQNANSYLHLREKDLAV